MANAICAKTNASVEPIASNKRLLPLVAIADATEARSLEELVPPPSLAHDWAQIVRYMQRYTQYVNSVAGYTHAQDSKAAASAMHAAERVRKRAAGIAGRDGIARCAHRH